MKNKNYFSPSWLLLAMVLFLTGTYGAAAQVSRAKNKSFNAYHNNYQRLSNGCQSQSSMEIRNGILWGSGYNAYGQLGDGTTINKSSFVQIGTDADWATVSCAYTHTLAIKSNGTLWGWGSNAAGALGDGTSIPTHSPKKIGSDNKWIMVTGGNSFSLGVKSDGTLWAWGWNSDGQLGDGTLTERYTPVQVGTDHDWTTVSCGNKHTVGMKADGTLWAWGENTSGQLGDGSLTSRLSPVPIGTDHDWASVVCGESYTMAIKSNGTLWGWGSNTTGQLGDGTNVLKNFPVQSGPANNWVAVSCGQAHTLAIKSDGTLWGWGVNSVGELGDGTNVAKNNAVQIGSGHNWVSVSCGYFHVRALKSDGTSWSWGWNFSGQLGNGTITNLFFPVLTANDPKEWISLGCGNYFTVALHSGGTLWSWGDNTYGQLGNGTTTSSNSPFQTGTANNWMAVSCGQNHTAALQSNGTLWTWGLNDKGQLGDGTTTNRNIPVQVGTGTDWVSVSEGAFFTVAIKSDGTLWSWGDNLFGELGDGTNTDRWSPVQIGTSNDWISVKTGANHTLALKSNGTLWSWGNNDYGQCGTGGGSSNAPAQVGSATNWTTIAAGLFYSTAIKSDGTLWAWGYNFNGELGDGTNTNVSAPEQIGSGNNWISVVAHESGSHTIGINSAGELWAWGYNGLGGLGDGTYDEKSSPELISGQSGVVYAANGGRHTGIIKADRTIICITGSNSNGELGNGTTGGSTLTYACSLNSIVCANPSQPALSASSTSNCETQSTTLSIQSGNLNSAADWQWYTGSCGGTSAGIGTSITVSPSITTTYYARGEGGCVTAGNCSSITITVNTPQNWYLDTDNDGHYVSAPVSACASPGAGYNTTATQSGDCNDADNTQWQSASLYIDVDVDGYDNGSAVICYGTIVPAGYSTTTSGSDCDDLNALHQATQTWYLDADLDGYSVSSQFFCGDPGAGYTLSAIAGDCDDADNTKWQNVEVYIDNDNDGYDNGTTTLCYGYALPGGYSLTTSGSDCDDLSTSVHEVLTWYFDGDGDDHYTSSLTSCGSPAAGYTTTEGISGDCDDQDNSKWQSGLLYIDEDADGYTYDNGAPDPRVIVCYGDIVPSGYSATTSGNDCNDNDASVHTLQQYYVDADLDGYGSTATEMLCYTAPTEGFSTDHSDCNDNDTQVNPSATEICNSIDDDCDFVTDENGINASINAESPVTFCEGGNVTLNAAPAVEGYTYQWFDANGAIAGATSNTYVSYLSGNYHAEVGSFSCVGASNTIVVTVHPLPAANVSPAGPFTLCKGTPVPLFANTGNGLSYQWYKGNSILIGETNDTYTIGGTASKSYKVIVSNASGCSDTSNIVTVTRLATPNAKITIVNSSANPDLCVNGKVKLRGNGSADVLLGYQWSYNDNVIAGATNRDYTATVAGNYKVQVTNLATGCNTNSNPISVINSCKEENAADQGQAQFSLYPNPTTGQFIVALHLDANISGVAIVKVYNALGQPVIEDDVAIVDGVLQKEVGLPNEVAAGIYFVQIAFEEEVFNRQIVYQK